MLIYEIPYQATAQTIWHGEGVPRHKLVLIVDNGYNVRDDTNSPTMMIVDYTNNQWFHLDLVTMATLAKHLVNGHKVQAIKTVRDLTKLGLYEAKQIVDYMGEHMILIPVQHEIEVEDFYFK